MFQKFRNNTRLQLFMIAGSLAVISCFFGLSAYLEDTSETLETPFKMRLGEEFDVLIQSDGYQADSEIVPGGTAAYDPYLINNGNYDMYVFMEVTLPDQTFHLNDLSSDWTQISRNDNTYIYAYGSETVLSTLPAKSRGDSGLVSAKTPALCGSVILDGTTDLDQNTYTVEAMGYAIQSDVLQSHDPKTVWGMIGGQQ